MSTEQQPATTAPATPPAPATPHIADPTAPKVEPNALAQAITGGWDKFKQGQLISYPLMALMLLLVTGIGVTWWVLHERNKTRSAMWVELDEADRVNSVTALEDFIKKYPDSKQAKLATLEIARTQLGPEGIEKLQVRSTDFSPAAGVNPDAKAREVRTTAVKNVETARETFVKLVDDFKGDPVIHVQCLMACAKAEAVLVGMSKEGQVMDPLNPKPIESRGDPKKAIEWLDRVAEAAPDTDWGKDAKKLADTLRNQKTADQVHLLQSSVYNVTPELPGFGGPQMPGFPGGLGGLGGLGGPPGGP